MFIKELSPQRWSHSDRPLMHYQLQRGQKCKQWYTRIKFLALAIKKSGKENQKNIYLGLSLLSRLFNA